MLSWWPAEVLHPLHVPDNIEALRHSVGEFPLRFFGSGDYAYLSRGRVFAYCDGDTAGGTSQKASGTRTVNKQFELGTDKASSDEKRLKIPNSGYVLLESCFSAGRSGGEAAATQSSAVGERGGISNVDG